MNPEQQKPDNLPVAPEQVTPREADAPTEPEASPASASISTDALPPVASQNIVPQPALAALVTPHENPGKVLGIIGLIFAFLPLQIIGLILSIIALFKSQSGSSARILGIVGVILNTLSLLIVLFFAFIVFVAASQVSELAKETEQKAAAAQEKTIDSMKDALIYYSGANNDFPQSLAELKTSFPNETFGPLTDSSDPQTVVYEYALCNNDTVARIGYMDARTKQPVYSYISDTQVPKTDPTDCQVVTL